MLDAGWGGWAALRATISAAGVTAAELADTRLLNHHEGKVVGIIETVQDHGVGLGEGLSLRGLKRSEDDGLEDVSDIDVASEEFQHFQSVADIAEVEIDVGLGVAIPGHEVAKFTRKQDSLHELVVEREHREQSFPYLLATQFCANAVFGEYGEGVSAGVPQCLEAVIEQGFENVTVVRVQGHPGVLLLVVHSVFFCGDERAAMPTGSTPSGIGGRGCRGGGKYDAEGLRAGACGTGGERRQWGSLFSSRYCRILQGHLGRVHRERRLH
jgi:hypothetical protein